MKTVALLFALFLAGCAAREPYHPTKEDIVAGEVIELLNSK